MPATAAPDIDQFWTALTFQLRGYVRTWRFLGLLLFVGGISAVVVGIDLYRGSAVITATSPTASDFLNGFLGNVTSAVIITAAFLGGDALAVDLAGGPGYLMLTQPVRRGTLLLGRFVAAALAGFAIALVYFAFAIGTTLYFYQTLPVAIAVSLGAAFLFGLAALAIAFFFSSFFRTPAIAIVASLLILILAFPLVTSIGTFTGVEPWFSLDYGGQVISNVFASDFAHRTVQHVGGGGPRGITITLYVWSPYLWEGVAIMVGYLGIFLGLTYVLYRYKEVKA